MRYVIHLPRGINPACKIELECASTDTAEAIADKLAAALDCPWWTVEQPAACMPSARTA